MTFLPVVSSDIALERMSSIFPKDAFRSTLSSPLSGKAIAGLIWAGCVVEKDDDELAVDLPYARPSTVLWMNESLLSVKDEDRRQAWYRAAMKSKKAVQALMLDWGLDTDPWYADNSRETLRDEFFNELASYGALLGAPHIDTNSPRPRWILRRDFAELFDPELTGDELTAATDAWIRTHMSKNGRVRAQLARKRAKHSVSVSVTLPDGENRLLNPGNSSELLQGVIEGWAPLRLKDPVVLTISEPGDKVYLSDQAQLRALGININVSKLLPDALLVDLGTDPLEFWVIEAVATDGPVSEPRKEKLRKWAKDQGIDPDNLRYLTAFLSRHHPAAKRLLASLAPGTHAWFLDEPDRELAWAEIESTIPNNIISMHK